jgi:hypothetical protein
MDLRREGGEMEGQIKARGPAKRQRRTTNTMEKKCSDAHFISLSMQSSSTNVAHMIMVAEVAAATFGFTPK